MIAFEIIKTRQVAHQTVKEVQRKLSAFGEVGEINERVQKSVTPPQFLLIVLYGAGVTALLAYVKAFFSKLGEATAETILDKDKLKAAAMAPEIRPLHELARTLLKAAASPDPHIRVRIALPRPDELAGSVLELDAQDAAQMTLQLASFIAKADAIAQAVRSEMKTGMIHGPLTLSLQTNGRFHATFLDSGTMKRRELDIG